MANRPPIRLDKPARYEVFRNGNRVARSAYYKVTETFTGKHVEVRYAFITSSQRWDSDADDLRRAEFVRARAIRTLRNRIVALGATNMLTLTYRANMADLEVARKHLREFYQRVKKQIPGWKFCGVAEYQKRGAVHWHLALKGFQDVRLLRAIWQSVIGEYGGNIDVKFFKGKGAGAIADYITKYLGKGFELDEKPRYSHYYVTSRGLHFETQTYRLTGYGDDDLNAFIADLFAQKNVKVQTRWWRSPWNPSGGQRSW